MANNFLKLKNIKIKLIDGFEFPTKRPGSHILWDYAPKELFHSDTIASFKDLGIQVRYPLLFWLKPGITTSIHIDGYSTAPGVWAINLILNPSSCKMTWFKPLKEGKTIFEFGYPNTSWKPDDCEVIEECVIEHNQPVLVNIGIPHRVQSLSENERWCLSLRGFSTDSKNWNDALKKFQEIENI